MRKYHQAALTLTAAFSLIALMFYRHEYNKLRFVLQVFNYFGKPMKNGYYYDNCTSNMPISMRLNSDYSEPISSWQRLSDNFYVYSSYRVNDYEIKTIAFGEDTDIINYSCKIYIDDDDDGNYNNENNNNNNIVSVPGDFSYVVMDSTHQPQSTNDVYEGDKTYSGFILTCKCQMAIDNDKQVIGVEYSSSPSTATNNDEYIYQSVHTIIDDNNNNNNNKSAMAICITPYNSNSNNLPKRMDMISYLSFNHYIGLNNFIIYNSDIISHVFNNGLKALAALTSNSNNSFTYTTVTWNFPYKNMPSFILRKIIETDCIYRSYNKAAFSMTFEWNEYLNLNHHSTFLNLLSNIDRSIFFGTTEAAADTTLIRNNKNKNIDRYEINVVTYCTDMASHDSFNNTTPIILRATRRLVNNKFTQQRFVYKLINNINNIADNKLITKDNMNDFVVINKYEKCFIDDKNKNQLLENGLLKFAEFMTNSQIFQFYISGKLFY